MRLDLPVGKRFGKLVVLGRGPDHIQENGRHRVVWTCQCDCGAIKDIVGEHVRDGRVRSCGCLAKELLSKRQSTHGLSKTPLYNIWCGMKARCYNPNSEFFRHYGGRGIFMCDEWKDAFEPFRDWALANGYQDGLTIDRTDNNKGYYPENCAWVSMAEQCNNRRSNINITYLGETHNLTQWCNILGLDYKRTHARIRKCGWTPERAFTT